MPNDIRTEDARITDRAVLEQTENSRSNISCGFVFADGCEQESNLIKALVVSPVLGIFLHHRLSMTASCKFQAWKLT